MTSEPPNPKKPGEINIPNIRIDFVIEDSRINEETGEFRFLLVPDPQVWEKKTVNGVEGYVSKLDNYFISKDVLASTAKQMVGMPIKYNPPGFEGKQEYLQRSKKRLDEYDKSNQK
jgi:hypothetical protein